MHTRDMNDEERMAMMAAYVPRLKDISHLNQNQFFQYIGSDLLLEHGVCKALELVGEAAYYMTPDGKAYYSTIDFDVWIRWRHLITHAYESVDMVEVWVTIWKRIPGLYSSLREYGFL